MWQRQDRIKSALDIANEFARTYFEEPRKIKDLYVDGPQVDGSLLSGTFKIVGGKQVYRLSVDRTYTWKVEAKLMT